MDHRAFLSRLSADERRDLTARSDGPGLVRLTSHLGLILFFGFWVASGEWAWPVAILPLGVLLVFLFTPLHESIHDTVFTRPAWNRMLAWFCGFILLIPPVWFRAFHFAHHKFTHDPARDPELAQPKPSGWRGYLYYLSGIPVWSGIIRTLLTNALGRADAPFVSERQKPRVTAEARQFLGLYAAALFVSIMLGSAVLFWVWVLPLLIGQPFLRAYLLAEHTLCPHSDDMFSNTRTTFTHRLVRWLAWNMPYHAEHHAFPTVPFHKLPQLHDLTRQHLRETATGYADFHMEYQRQLTS